MPNTKPCPFCNIEAERIIQQNEFGFTVRDAFPVSQGHSLIIPKRHVGSFFDLSVEEQHGLLELLNACHAGLESLLRERSECIEYPASSVFPRHSKLDLESSTSQSEVKVPSSSRPEPVEGRSLSSVEGFNIGINDGAAAGQTVPHCHIHLIPRYKGDVKDPRGGVRWVLPEKADYWSKP